MGVKPWHFIQPKAPLIPLFSVAIHNSNPTFECFSGYKSPKSPKPLQNIGKVCCCHPIHPSFLLTPPPLLPPNWSGSPHHLLCLIKKKIIIKKSAFNWLCLVSFLIRVELFCFVSVKSAGQVCVWTAETETETETQPQPTKHKKDRMLHSAVMNL